MTAIAFGPIPSRRLGRSLGINNIPPKSCSYGCRYCQVGPTPGTSLGRREFYPPERIVGEVEERLAALRARGEGVDFLTFVPDGEPTLDVHLGDEIDRLRPLGVPIAVISNASLLWQAEVRAALARADWVSLKVDAVDENVWRRIDRPSGGLRLATVLDGVLRFARAFTGFLATETMLVEGVNDGSECVERTADFLVRVAPRKAYLLVPTRPTAEASARRPNAESVAAACRTFAARLPSVELLAGEESAGYGSTGDAERDLLATTAVHPMLEEAVRDLLARDGAGWTLVEDLLARGELAVVEHHGRRFFVVPAAQRRKRSERTG